MCRCAEKILLFLLLTFIVSCKVEVPQWVLPPEKMEAVLYDYHLAQSMMTTLASVDYKEKLMYTYIYDKHGVSKQVFDSSLVWYNRYPKHIERIYANIEMRLNDEIDALANAKVAMEDGVDLDKVDFSSPIVELWTSHPVKMLSATPLGNRLHFAFDVPKDSSFIAGDSLVFSFKALFLPAGNDSVRPKAYASIALEYENGFCYVVGVDVDTAGHYFMSAPRDTVNRMKSMAGQIFYFDNDAAHESKSVFSELSVKRLRAVPNMKD